MIYKAWLRQHQGRRALKGWMREGWHCCAGCTAEGHEGSGRLLVLVQALTSPKLATAG